MIKEYDFYSKLNSFTNQFEKVDYMNNYAWEIKRSFPSKALQIASESMTLSFEKNYKKGIAESLKISGTSYYLLSVYESGIIDLNKARNLFLKLKDRKSEAECIRNLGNIYHAIHEYDKSIEYYEKAKIISIALNDQKDTAYNIGNIGYVHYLCKRYDEALPLLKKTHEILVSINDEQGVADVLNSIGKIFFEIDQNESAFECFEQALKISKDLNHLRGITTALANLGSYHLIKNDLKKSVEFLNEAYDVAEKMQTKSLMGDITLKLSLVYEKMIDFEKALYYFKKYDTLKTEILNTSNKNIITAVQVQFDLEQVEKEKEKFVIKNKELARIQKELEEKNTKLELLSLVASQSDNVIIIMNEKGEVIFVNECFMKFNQVTLKELIAQKGKTIFEISNSPDIRKYFDECILTKKSITYESLNISKTGKNVWSSALLTPVYNLNGILTNFVIIDTDITERKRAQEIIDQKNTDITASITYGKRIQEAILPEKSKIISHFDDCFILNKPKDIVSGDFYWFDDLNGQIVFAVSDCTGHGVPGAFMSMIGIDLLHQIVNDSRITTPSIVLESLDKKIKRALKQTGELNETTDGMDIAFCNFNFSKENQEHPILNYSGAYRPLWMIRNGVLIEIKADRYSIGGDVTKDKTFNNHSIKTEKGDVFYIFTDGCIDLFGGSYGKKFRATRLKDLLLEIYTKPMEQQEAIISKVLSDWQGDLEQVDDILMMGFKLK